MGGKDSALATHKAIKSGHKITCLVTFLWQKPSNAHTLDLIKLPAKASKSPTSGTNLNHPTSKHTNKP